MGRKTITRKELYDKIWTITKNKTAEELGLTYPVLTEICKKHNIPVPTSHYWLKISWNQPVEKTPLPDPESNPTINLDIHKPVKRVVNSPVNEENGNGVNQAVTKDSDRERKALLNQSRKGLFIIDFSQDYEFWKENIPSVVRAFPVAEKLKTQNEMVLQTKAYHRLSQMSWSKQREHPDYERLQTHLSITVTNEVFDRALRIFDSIINIIESIGGKMIYKQRNTSIELAGVEIAISITEKYRRVENKSAGRWDPKFTDLSTGQLRVKLGPSYKHYTVEDTPYSTLENKLDNIIYKCLQLVQEEFKLREYHRKQEIERQRREEQRRLEEQRQRELEERRENERNEARELFRILRRDILMRLIDRTLTDSRQFSGLNTSSTDPTELYERLRRLRNLLDPNTHKQTFSSLSEEDINSLAEEFFGG